MDKRVTWIDMLKGYGIFIVTLGHLGVNFLLEKHIYSYHMFLFFFISGYLFNEERKFRETLKQKTKTILVPFIAWDLVSSIIGAVAYNLTIRELIMTIFIIKGRLCFNAPIWFLLVLYLTEAIYAYIKKYLSSYIIIFLAIVLFISVGSYMISLKLNLIPLALLAYALGNLTKSNLTIFVKRNGYLMCVVLVLLATISIIWGVFKNVRISYTASMFGNVWSYIIAAISGTLFVFFVFFYLFRETPNNMVAYVGKNSFVIMVMQYYFFTLYNVIGEKMLNITDIWHTENSVKAVGLSVVTIALCLASAEVYRNFARKSILLKNIGEVFGIL